MWCIFIVVFFGGFFVCVGEEVKLVLYDFKVMYD